MGIGGGSGFMTARGAANALTRTTGILAIAFFATSLSLSILARYGGRRPISSIACPRRSRGEQQPSAPAGGSNGVLDKLGGQPAAPATPTAPTTSAPPAAPTPAADPAAPATPQVPSGQ